MSEYSVTQDMVKHIKDEWVFRILQQRWYKYNENGYYKIDHISNCHLFENILKIISTDLIYNKIWIT